MSNHLRALPVFRPINTLSANLTACDWAVTADESSGSLRFFRPLKKKRNLIKYYFAFEIQLRISDQKFQNFAECIAGKGKFCGRMLRKKIRVQMISRVLVVHMVASCRKEQN